MNIKKVIIICEENLGTIGVAVDLESAIRWLIQKDWITAYTKFWVDNRRQSPLEMFGDRWRESIVKQKEEFFDGNFYFYEEELIGAIDD